MDSVQSVEKSADRLDAVDMVASTGEPSFAVDQDFRVIAWNPAIERLTGLAEPAAVGRSCHEVMAGRDVFGNRFCGEGCALSAMARKGEPTRHFEIDVRTSRGDPLRVAVIAIVIRDAPSGSFNIIHVLQPTADPRPDLDSPPGAWLATGDVPMEERDHSSAALTGREIEVLRLLERGEPTEDDAKILGISAKTVRNHIHNVFRKIGAHNRLEAVRIAKSRGMI